LKRLFLPSKEYAHPVRQFSISGSNVNEKPCFVGRRYMNLRKGGKS